MATKTFYILTTAATSPDWCGSLQEGGSAPTAANSAYGWNVQKTSANTFWRGRIGATATSGTSQASSFLDASTGPQLGTGSGNTTASDFFNTPVNYNGTFAAGNWTFAWNFRTGAATHSGQVRMRVWASTSDTGSSPRELTSGALAGTIITLNSTTADFNSGITWNAPSISLINEFLFFELEWKITTAGGSNSCTALFRIGTSSITTTDFAANTIVTTTASAAGVGATSPVVNCVKQSAASAAGIGGSLVVGDLSTSIPGIFATNEAWSPQPPILLLHCDGQNGSTSFPDNVGGHTITPVGAAQIDAGQGVFGQAAVFNSAQDYLQADGAADFAIGTGDFQFDCRVRFNDYDNYELIDWGGSGPMLRVGVDGKLDYQIGGVDKINGTTVLSVNTFYHVSVSRAGGITRLWLNGVQEGSDYVASDNITISADRPTFGTRS